MKYCVATMAIPVQLGLIPARMSLVAPDLTVLARRPLVTDVRGSVLSAYGIFGLAGRLVTPWAKGTAA